MMEEAEPDVLAYMTFPKAHRTKIYSTNPLERLNAEIKRRTRVVGIFPNEAAIVRLVGALLLEQNDEWQLNRRYMQLEGLPRGTLPEQTRGRRENTMHGLSALAVSEPWVRTNANAVNMGRELTGFFRQTGDPNGNIASERRESYGH